MISEEVCVWVNGPDKAFPHSDWDDLKLLRKSNTHITLEEIHREFSLYIFRRFLSHLETCSTIMLQDTEAFKGKSTAKTKT